MEAAAALVVAVVRLEGDGLRSACWHLADAGEVKHRVTSLAHV